MTDSKSELIISKTILSAQAEVLISREKKIRNIREKALRAYAERRKPKPQRKPMTAEERRAVWNTLKATPYNAANKFSQIKLNA